MRQRYKYLSHFKEPIRAELLTLLQLFFTCNNCFYLIFNIQFITNEHEVTFCNISSPQIGDWMAVTLLLLLMMLLMLMMLLLMMLLMLMMYVDVVDVDDK